MENCGQRQNWLLNKDTGTINKIQGKFYQRLIGIRNTALN
jgi:hypothetical protein